MIKCISIQKLRILSFYRSLLVSLAEPYLEKKIEVLANFIDDCDQIGEMNSSLQSNGAYDCHGIEVLLFVRKMELEVCVADAQS